MCGRFANYFDENTIIDAFGVERVLGLIIPTWNLAPTQQLDLVRDVPASQDSSPDNSASGMKTDKGADTVRQAQTAKWGLVPSWAKDPKTGSRLFNARSETVTVKPSFRAAARRRRALIPASGYFEWQAAADGTRVPYYLHPEPDGQVLAFAGLYEWWRAPDDQAESLLTATIITRAASDQLGHIHDRMPLVVPPDLFADWLSPDVTAPTEVDSMIRAMGDPVLVPRQVGKAVGLVKNNHPGLIQPVG
ncbi:MAG: SOS response-associated peptidase [Micrococcales bacterium]|nr:SOS response-associated peptidase [Micrococcales bacterium]